MFSVLIPSRNRLELLKLAVQSVLLQDFGDFEIVISDNASDEDYRGFAEGLADPRVRYVRSDTPLSVTENWNRALRASSGEYVVMLGDDDALAPGYLAHQAQLIAQFDKPDVVYSMCYHYTYPGVVAGAPDGYFVTVDNSVLFRGHAAPYELNTQDARRLGRIAASFRHQISFNAQHYLYRRAYLDSLADLGPFYQSPYPDYYASFLTFLTAPRIIVDPQPRMIIGIAKQSFGFFFMNQREEEGRSQFLGDPVDMAFLAGDDTAITRAIEHPGVSHARNWLLASLQLKRRLEGRLELAVDLRRYGRLQTMEMALLAGYEDREPRRSYYAFMQGLSGHDLAFARRTLETAMTVKRLKIADTRSVMLGVQGLLNIYYPAAVQYHPLPAHQNILDAVRWLDPSTAATPAPPPAAPEAGVHDLSARLGVVEAEHQALLLRKADLDESLKRMVQAHAQATELLASLEMQLAASRLAERQAVEERDHLRDERNVLERSMVWRATKRLRGALTRLDKKG